MYCSNLYINGNNLQCVGATKLLKPITDCAESLGKERKSTLPGSNNSAYQITAGQLYIDYKPLLVQAFVVNKCFC